MYGNESIEIEKFSVSDDEDKRFTVRIGEAGYSLFNDAGQELVKASFGQQIKFSQNGTVGSIYVKSAHARPGAEFRLRSTSKLDVIDSLKKDLIA